MVSRPRRGIRPKVCGHGVETFGQSAVAWSGDHATPPGQSIMKQSTKQIILGIVLVGLLGYAKIRGAGGFDQFWNQVTGKANPFDAGPLENSEALRRYG